ncbi:thioesterase family protein [Aquabacter cavernae]|uniref:thioesterase family protein n=1 Tax=Aquabacter cavernae TaxID=2496029 RepID=UPI000F8E9E0A|nr:thioesterase family protein [Aquabacter cavernae]
MGFRTDFEPVFFAPFVSSPMAIEPEWVETTGHLDMAYSYLLFERARTEALALLGLGLHYERARRSSFATTEIQVRHLRGPGSGGPVRATVRLVDYDERRLHVFLQLHRADEGWVFAVSEQMVEHVDMASGRSIPFPDDVLERISGMKAVHASLPLPDAFGQRAGMPLRS